MVEAPRQRDATKTKYWFAQTRNGPSHFGGVCVNDVLSELRNKSSFARKEPCQKSSSEARPSAQDKPGRNAEERFSSLFGTYSLQILRNCAEMFHLEWNCYCLRFSSVCVDRVCTAGMRHGSDARGSSCPGAHGQGYARGSCCSGSNKLDC